MNVPFPTHPPVLVPVHGIGMVARRAARASCPLVPSARFVRHSPRVMHVAHVSGAPRKDDGTNAGDPGTGHPPGVPGGPGHATTIGVNAGAVAVRAMIASDCCEMCLLLLVPVN
jgi:hypothetical protein